MSDWCKCAASEVQLGDIIDHNGTHGRVNFVETIKRDDGQQHWTSPSNVGKLRIGVQGTRELVIAPDTVIEVYR